MSKVRVNSLNQPLNRKLRMALIGGGGSGFIGRVHAIAATLDGRAELVAGALSSDPQRARRAAVDFGIAPNRAYGSSGELIEAESRLPDDERVDFVAVATPNYTHFDIAMSAVAARMNVVCDKPMTIDLKQAEQLAARVEQCGVVFAVAHGYAGYPMVRQAREMIRQGDLGEIRAVRISYLQGGLHSLTPGKPPSRGAWKADPALAGPSGTMSDLGTHAYHLLRFTTELRPTELSCTLANFHPARPLDDYGHALLRLSNDALGMITVSQITHGRLNHISLEVDGTTGSLSWRQESPDQLILRRFGKPVLTYERNRRAADLSDTVRAACRLPGGHPEGFFEALANVYADCFDDMVKRSVGQEADTRQTAYPNVFDGLEGVLFVQQCLASSRDRGVWLPLVHRLIR